MDQNSKLPYEERLKVYLLIADDVPIGHAINCASHAGTAIVVNNPNDPVIKDWSENHFYCATCKVSREDFDYAKNFGKHEVIAEGALDHKEVALIFHPRRHDQWEPFFKFLPLFK